MLRQCTVCFSMLDTADFYVINKTRNRLHSQCKRCYKIKREAFKVDHYEKYKEAYRLRARLRKNEIKLKLQNKLYSYLKDKCCEDCGFKDLRALDFDHIEPTEKSFGIAKAISYGYKWEKITKEIEKCRILCANCHRIRTAVQYNWKKPGALAEK